MISTTTDRPFGWNGLSIIDKKIPKFKNKKERLDVDVECTKIIDFTERCIINSAFMYKKVQEFPSKTPVVNVDKLLRKSYVKF